MNFALILAGGRGERMKSEGTPKQFREIKNQPILIRTVKHFDNHPLIDGIFVVCLETWIDTFSDWILKYALKKIIDVIPGGDSGQESIRKGLEAIEDFVGFGTNPIVLIHDGVRPLINEQIITKNIETVQEKGNAVTVSPQVESVAMISEDREILEVLDRQQSCVARAPQSFYLSDILGAHRMADVDGMTKPMIDSAMLMTHYGHKLYTVEGPQENIKVTTPLDYYLCCALIESQNGNKLMNTE